MSGIIIGDKMEKGDGSTQYSPTFPRNGLGVTFVMQALSKIGTTPNMAVGIEHKNETDLSWTTLGSFSAITAVGMYTVDLTLPKEQLRFSFAVTATNPWEGYLLSMLSPSWRAYP